MSLGQLLHTCIHGRTAYGPPSNKIASPTHESTTTPPTRGGGLGGGGAAHHREGVEDEEAPVGADAGVADGPSHVVGQAAVDDALAESQRAPDQQEERPVHVSDRLLSVHPAPEDKDRTCREGCLDLA